MNGGVRGNHFDRKLTSIWRMWVVILGLCSLPDPPTTITGERAVLPANDTIQTNQWKKVSLRLKNVLTYLETYVFKVPSHQSHTNSRSDRLVQTVTVSTWALGLCSTSQAIETSFKRWVEIVWYNWDSYAFWTVLSDQLLKLLYLFELKTWRP